jgi:uncharacterized protein YecE (DUF72 family)
VDTALANCFAAGTLALGPKLGPILWQLPPSLGFDADRLAGSSRGCPGRRPPRRNSRADTTTGSPITR